MSFLRTFDRSQLSKAQCPENPRRQQREDTQRDDSTEHGVLNNEAFNAQRHLNRLVIRVANRWAEFVMPLFKRTT